MKKTVLITISFLFTLNLFSQIDAVKIQSAKKAYDAKEYNIALESLNEVTSVGRKSKLFNYYKGYAHFELKQYDSAEVYLKKYLLLDITNEKVQSTLGDIDYEKKYLKKQRDDKENCIKNCYKCSGSGVYKYTEKIKCDKCNYIGRVCGKCDLTGTCTDCKGTGRELLYTNKWTGESTYDTCLSCKGVGICKEDHDCKYCTSGYTYEKYTDKCSHPNCK